LHVNENSTLALLVSEEQEESALMLAKRKKGDRLNFPKLLQGLFLTPATFNNVRYRTPIRLVNLALYSTNEAMRWDITVSMLNTLFWLTPMKKEQNEYLINK
jgi:hypothetical protein